MAPSEHREALFRSARLAYERGRVQRALLAAWPVPLAVLVALRVNHSLEWVATLGALLLAMVIALRWRGLELGRGVGPGLMAGIAPLAIPALTVTCMQDCTTACPPTGLSWCQMSCIAGGILGGALVGLRAAYFGPGWMRFLAAALAVAGVTGALGCLLGGALGIMGMVAGFVFGAVPVLVLVPRHA